MILMAVVVMLKMLMMAVEVDDGVMVVVIKVIMRTAEWRGSCTGDVL